MTTTATPFARTTDPETSHEAAEQLTKRSLYVDRVVAFLYQNDREEGWTEYEITQALGKELGECPWHRISDARSEGFAEWTVTAAGTKVRRPGATSRSQGASNITPKGQEHYLLQNPS